MSSSDHSQKQLVIVTGSNTGIGYEIVKKLSADNPDTHQILLTSRDKAKGESALKSLNSPSNVSVVQLDVTNDASIDALYQHVESAYGKVDTLIHNAGIASGPTKDATLRETYQAIYNTNVFGPAVMTEKFTPLLEKSALPKVIFISSQLGSIQDHLAGVAFFKAAPYSSSKSAMNYHAAYYSRLHPTWRVNAVCPGLNATALNGIPLTDDLHPRNGAIRAVELVTENMAGRSGTFSNRFERLPW